MRKIRLTHACSDKPEFIAEIKIGNFLDLAAICKSAHDSSFFKSVTCLSRAGIVRATYGTKSIMVFGNGRITINCVKNEKEAYEFVQLLIRVLKPLQVLNKNK